MWADYSHLDVPLKTGLFGMLKITVMNYFPIKAHVMFLLLYCQINDLCLCFSNQEFAVLTELQRWRCWQHVHDLHCMCELLLSPVRLLLWKSVRSINVLYTNIFFITCSDFVEQQRGWTGSRWAWQSSDHLEQVSDIIRSILKMKLK